MRVQASTLSGYLWCRHDVANRCTAKTLHIKLSTSTLFCPLLTTNLQNTLNLNSSDVMVCELRIRNNASGEANVPRYWCQQHRHYQSSSETATATTFAFALYFLVCDGSRTELVSKFYAVLVPVRTSAQILSKFGEGHLHPAHSRLLSSRLHNVCCSFFPNEALDCSTTNRRCLFS